MYGNVARLVGFVSVKQTDSHIIVNGVPGLRFSRDVYNYWKTSKLNNNMFTSISKSQIKFPKFFGIEVLYMFERLMESRRTSVSRRLLLKTIEELTSHTWLSKIGKGDISPKLNYNKLKDLNITLFAHQDNFLRTYDRVTQEYDLKGMLMDVAAGGGKTLTGYALGHICGADTQIYVVPKNSAVDVWEKTIAQKLPQYGGEYLFKTGVPDYWTSMSGQEPVVGKKIYIVHYDYLDKFLKFAKNNQRAFGRVFVDIDESHNFNEESQRTGSLIDLCQTLNAKDVIHASGTPFKAMGSEAITLLSTICSDFTPEVKAAFRKIFGKEAKRANEILANRIGIVSFKVFKQDIETPGVDYHEVKVKIPNGVEYTLDSIRAKMTVFIAERMAMYQKGMPEYQKLYDTCMELHGKSLMRASPQQIRDFDTYKSYIKQIRRGYDAATMKDIVMYCNMYELKKIVPSLPEAYRKPFLNVRAIIKYVELKVLGEALSQVLGKLRIQCHLDMLPFMPLDEIIDNATKKTVIFTSYVEVVKELEIMLVKAGYKPMLVYGETNKDLPAIIKKFHEDPDCNPLVATFKSLSTAVPLTAANSLIFTNSPFRDYERTQTVARVDRIGQTERCHVHDIFLDTGESPNISTRSKDIMQWSRDQVETILGVKSPDDIEASLEALVENPNATLTSAEDFIEQLKAELPIDVIEVDNVERDDVSMEGLFGSNAPKLDIRNKAAAGKIIKDTYLNDSWLSKQKFKSGEFEHEKGSLISDSVRTVMTGDLDRYKQVAYKAVAMIAPIASSFAKGGWKDAGKVAAWHKQIRETTVKTRNATATVKVIIDFPEWPNVKSASPKKGTVTLLADKAAVKKAAEELYRFLELPGLWLHDYANLDIYNKEAKAFDPEGEGDLLYALDNTGVSHVQAAVDVHNAIQESFEKVGSDLVNSKDYNDLLNQHTAVAQVLWARISKSTK